MSTTPPEPRVVVAAERFLDGSPRQQAGRAVRDLKLLSPEAGRQAKTRGFGFVEIDPAHRSPPHRQNRDEISCVVRGAGEIESGDRQYPLSPGCALRNLAHEVHRLHAPGDEPRRLVVVAGILLVPLWPPRPAASPSGSSEDSSAEARGPAETAERAS